MEVTNHDHLKMLINISNSTVVPLLVQLLPHLDTLTDEEYHDLVVGIRNGTITDLEYLNNRETEIDI